MSMKNFNTVEGIFFVDITEADQKQVDSYYTNTGEIKSSSTSAHTPRIFKKATIRSTFDNDRFPVGSVWVMGETPGMKVNFFGEKITIVQEKDLYARIP